MTLTLLLDLDDTLLDTNMGEFIPAYFQALSRHLVGRVQPESMLPALMTGTQLMLASEDPSHTLQEVFESFFYPKLGVPKEQLKDLIEQFYDEVFPSLGGVTKQRTGARELVEWALSMGYCIAIATDPLFPRKATYQRIRWAGLDPERFELVSSFEDFHFSKSHPAYFAEVVGRLGWPAGPVVMVGNDAERDLMPAQKLGLATYHVVQESDSRAGPNKDGRGSLTGLRPWLESVDPAALEPSLQTPQAILSVMASTPAVMRGLTSTLPKDAWPRRPAADEWALIEVVCHLRDTEREIHNMQIETMLGKIESFIPRPDGGVWAKQRNYLEENGPLALHDFTSARMDVLERLKGLKTDVWTRKARHAIFGPTHFGEVIGFMADHDRMHIQQAWNVLKVF